MTDAVHLDSLSVVQRFTLIQLALMDPTELMGVMQQGHTGMYTFTHTHTQWFLQEDPNMYFTVPNIKFH